MSLNFEAMLQAGQILQGRYQLQEKLGQHQGRQTWLAQDIEHQSQKAVIVKIISFNSQMQWDEFKLFEREAKVLQNLNHPRIPRYRDFFRVKKEDSTQLGGFALVQDYIPGSSLSDRLKQGQHFSEAQVKAIAYQVLEILLYLHELSPPTLHRDIKPSNLILGEDEQIYLIDFGAVQNQAETEGNTFTVVGTVGYTPLEQFWGKAVPASDLYALGATLIHLVTGTEPANLPQDNLQIQFSDRVSINPNLVGWIQAISHPDLGQRLSSARQAIGLLQDLEAYPLKTAEICAPVSRIDINNTDNKLSINISQKGLKIRNFWAAVVKVFQAFCYPLVSLFTAYSNHSVYLDSSNLIIEWRIFKYCYRRQTCQTASIKTINATASSGIAIQTRYGIYHFAKGLNQAERQWLVKNVQAWVNQKQLN